MVYDFENAATIHQKVKFLKLLELDLDITYLRIEDVRPNRGEVTVVHIMILNPKPEDADQNKAENTINEIYKKNSTRRKV